MYLGLALRKFALLTEVGMAAHRATTVERNLLQRESRLITNAKKNLFQNEIKAHLVPVPCPWLLVATGPQPWPHILSGSQ